MSMHRVNQLARKAILDRDLWICQYCGNPANEVDHLVPWTKYPDNDPQNLLACCTRCNSIAFNIDFRSLEEKRSYILAEIARREATPKALPPYDQKYERRTYRIAAGVHDSLKQIAQVHSIGLNELVRSVFDRFLDDVEAGNVTIATRPIVTERREIERIF